eukprot:TRINITY_DN110_c0_g1_i5.p1 TRINITY_DN110_c0_g1~~TRINITY_DN110_c0_g1_i5.p1  ORF type:complete len:1379 (-),score=236.74 TRINITY_DN110_c0_g1_i5:32-4129(-)
MTDKPVYPNVWVGDLRTDVSFAVQKEALERAFSKHGNVVFVSIKETPKGRIAYVNFDSDVNAENAASKVQRIGGFGITTKYIPSPEALRRSSTNRAHINTPSNQTSHQSPNQNRSSNNTSSRPGQTRNAKNTQAYNQDRNTTRQYTTDNQRSSSPERNGAYSPAKNSYEQKSLKKTPFGGKSHKNNPYQSNDDEWKRGTPTQTSRVRICISKAEDQYLQKEKNLTSEMEKIMMSCHGDVSFGLEYIELRGDESTQFEDNVKTVKDMMSRLHKKLVIIPTQYAGRDLKIFKDEVKFRAENKFPKQIKAITQGQDQTDENNNRANTLEIICQDPTTLERIVASISDLSLFQESFAFQPQEFKKLVTDKPGNGRKEIDPTQWLKILAVELRVIVSPSLEDCNSLVVKSFNRRSLKKIKIRIDEYLKQDEQQITTVFLKDLQQTHVKYLMYHEKEFIRSLEVEYISVVQFEEKEKGLQIKIEGTNKKVKQLEDKIKLKLSTLLVEKIKISPTSAGRYAQILKDKRNDLGTEHRALITLPSPQNPQITVAALEQSCIDGVKSSIEKIFSESAAKSIQFGKEFDSIFTFLTKGNQKMQQELQKTWNVEIEINDDNNCIVINGLSQTSVDAVEGLLRSYATTKKEISKELCWKDPLLAIIMTNAAHKSNLDEVDKHNAEVFNVNGKLMMKGLATDVDECEKELNDYQDSLIKRLIDVVLLSLDTTAKNQKIASAKYNMKANIMLKYWGELSSRASELMVQIDKPIPSTRVFYRYLHKAPDGRGFLFEVRSSDLVVQKVDAIVNAANPKLNHAGGVAAAIAQAAGPDLVHECDKYVGMRGWRGISCGEVFVSTNGKLPCKKVIHAVGPRYDERDSKELFVKTITSIIEESDQKEFETIALPAMGSEIYGWPLKDAVKIITNTIVKIVVKKMPKHLKCVVFCDTKPDTIVHFGEQLTSLLGESNTDIRMNPQSEDLSVANIKTPSKHNWYWMEDDNTWKPYSNHELIDRAFEHGDSDHQLSADNSKWKNGVIYKIDFGSMQQINTQTGFKRQVKREENKDYDMMKSQQQQQQQQQQLLASRRNGSTSTNNDYEVRIKGLIGDVTEAKGEYDLWMKDKIRKAPIEKSNHSLAQTICERYPVICKLSKDNTINLIGDMDDINNVRNEILKQMERVLKEEYPSDWAPQTIDCELHDIQSNSNEWKRICSRMQETMGPFQVSRIQRVQNKRVWRKYYLQRELTKQKNKGAEVEKELFHGTGTTDPSSIIQGEDGFDMRFSKQGMWGLGTYFAQNAKYSDDNYAYRNGPSKQFFLAKVLTGKVDVRASDRNIRMPNLRADSPHGEQWRYDSVGGNTNGSDVYIVYDNSKAYPYYLITYQ